MELELSEKVVLVTGASRGIGRCIAEKLCAEGCRVAINARGEQDLRVVQSSLPGSVAIPGDVTSPDEADKVARKVIEIFGKLDVLVCNIGSGKSVSPGEETYCEWQRVFSNNLWATTNIVESSKSYLRNTRGVIVCISSICGGEVIPGAPVTYSCAKAALNAYVKGISRPLGAHGIRINAVAPGNILFPDSTWERKLKENEGQVTDMLRREVSLQKLGSPTDVADLVAYLASPLSQFATGSVWTLDGGQVRA